MSTHQSSAHGSNMPASHDDHHAAHGHGESAWHGTRKDYITGFVLAVVLTVIPFGLIMGNVIERSGVAALVILVLAAVQIVVHMVYFLHMNTRSESGWTVLALIFTIVLVVITLSGSIWVMYHLDTNMMPPSIHEMRNAP